MPATTQAPPQQAQATPSQAQRDAQLAAAVVAAFVAYMTADGIFAALRVPFRRAGIKDAALRGAIEVVMFFPMDPMEGTGDAGRRVITMNLARRVQFFIASARRMQQGISQAISEGRPSASVIRDLISAERRYFGQHVEANQGRIAAASRVDGMAWRYGPVLGWKAVRDSHTTAGCLAADGKNFRVDRPPVIEGHPAYPGMVHGTTCRCIPVPPYEGAPLIGGPDAGRSSRPTPHRIAAYAGR